LFTIHIPLPSAVKLKRKLYIIEFF